MANVGELRTPGLLKTPGLKATSSEKAILGLWQLPQLMLESIESMGSKKSRLPNSQRALLKALSSGKVKTALGQSTYSAETAGKAAPYSEPPRAPSGRRSPMGWNEIKPSRLDMPGNCWKRKYSDGGHKAETWHVAVVVGTP